MGVSSVETKTVAVVADSKLKIVACAARCAWPSSLQDHERRIQTRSSRGHSFSTAQKSKCGRSGKYQRQFKDTFVWQARSVYYMPRYHK
eukprot:6188456-Pleurochrysis_carterae.AAC.5